MAPTQIRRVWLTNLIREVHAASRGTCGSRPVHAEPTLGIGVHVSEHLVAVLMSMNRIAGLPSVGKVKRLRGVVTADDLINRKFHRPHPMSSGLLISPSIQRAKVRSTAALY
jgi:CBS domain-containing protein